MYEKNKLPTAQEMWREATGTHASEEFTAMYDRLISEITRYSEMPAMMLLYLARAEMAEANINKLKGLLHSELICDMHYCELHEMAYQRPDTCENAECPYCEVDRLYGVIESFPR